MRIPPNLSYLFKPTAAKNYIGRKRLPRANALFLNSYSRTPQKPEDYIYADDPRVLKMTEALSDTCNREFPVDVDETGFAGPSAIPSDFSAMRCVSGYGMDPLPLPVFDNAKLVQSLGLVSKIRPADVPWLKELIRLFFGAVAPANLHLRKRANAGFPFFTSDIIYRLDITRRVLANVDDFLDAIAGDRHGLSRAHSQYHALIIASIQERQQPDNVFRKADGSWDTKRRPVPSIEEALSGDFAGNKLFADKSFRDAAGNVIDGHFAMRRRTVFGMAGVVNYLLTGIMACHRSVYLDRFSFTYKARDDADKVDKIKNYKYIVGSDVKSMDTTIPRWFFDFLCEELEQYWDGRLVIMLRRMLAAPYVVPPPWRRTSPDYNPVFGGDPLDPQSFRSCVGLPSGIAINPDIGKLWMTFVYCILFKDCGALSSPSDIEPFLQGKNPRFGLLDTSDDAVLMTNVPHVAEALRVGKSPYSVLEPETPVQYLGSVFAMTSRGAASYPNAVTYLRNAIAREDSIDRIRVENYCEGVLARVEAYSSAPVFRDLHTIYEEHTRKFLGISPLAIARNLAIRQKFTGIDALVLSNPAYLHYRVDAEEVSPDVLADIMATIPAEDYFNDIRHLFKVPTDMVVHVKKQRQQHEIRR